MAGVAANTFAIVKYGQFLTVRAFPIDDGDSQRAPVEIAGRYVTLYRWPNMPSDVSAHVWPSCRLGTGLQPSRPPRLAQLGLDGLEPQASARAPTCGWQSSI